MCIYESAYLGRILGGDGGSCTYKRALVLLASYIAKEHIYKQCSLFRPLKVGVSWSQSDVEIGFIGLAHS